VPGDIAGNIPIKSCRQRLSDKPCYFLRPGLASFALSASRGMIYRAPRGGRHFEPTLVYFSMRACISKWMRRRSLTFTVPPATFTGVIP